MSNAYQPLAGCSIFGTQTWGKSGCTCEVCGKVKVWPSASLSAPPDAFIAVRVVEWGDDSNTARFKTKESTHTVCSSCFESDTQLLPFFVSKGFRLKD